MQEKASELSKKAIALASKYKYIEAIKVNIECLALKKELADNEGVAFCYDRLSGIYWRLCQRSSDANERLQLAKHAYEHAKLSSHSGRNSINRNINLVRMSELYGQQFLTLEMFSDAMKYFLESLAMNVLSEDVLDSRSYVFSCFRLMYIYAKYAWLATQEEESIDKIIISYRKAYEYGCLARKYMGVNEEKEQLSLLSKITHDYAKCLEEVGSTQEAIDVLESNFILNRQLGNKHIEWITRDKIASIYFRSGDLSKAKLIFENLLIEKDIKDKIVYDHSRHILAAIYDNLGRQAQDRKSYNKAKYYFERFLKLSQLNNDIRKIAEAEIRLAYLYLKKPDYQKSYELFKTGFDQFLNFVSKREGYDFTLKLSDMAQSKLIETRDFADNYDFKAAALCYAKVWDELAEKSKPVDRAHYVKRKAQELISSTRQKMLRNENNQMIDTVSRTQETYDRCV